MRSFESAIPKSPCNASKGFKYKDVRPNEEKVAAIFLATIPLLPTPEVINLPLFVKHLFKSLKLFSTCLLSSFSAVQAIAFASINKQSVKAEKLFHYA